METLSSCDIYQQIHLWTTSTISGSQIEHYTLGLIE